MNSDCSDVTFCSHLLGNSSLSTLPVMLKKKKEEEIDMATGVSLKGPRVHSRLFFDTCYVKKRKIWCQNQEP